MYLLENQLGAHSFILFHIIKYPSNISLVVNVKSTNFARKLRSQKTRCSEIYDPPHLDSGVFGGDRAGVDLDAEDALVRGVQRVAGLAPQAALHDHPELLALSLVQGDLHEAGGKGVVLDGELDDLAGLEEAHHRLLVADVPDVGGVDRQDPVAHPELPRGRGRAPGDDFTHVDSLKHKIWLKVVSMSNPG